MHGEQYNCPRFGDVEAAEFDSADYVGYFFAKLCLVRGRAEVT